MQEQQHMRATRFQKNSSLSKWLLTGLAMLFLTEWLGSVSAAPSSDDPGCRGVYDKSIFAKVDSVCYDCYNLFREPKLYGQCRNNCFTTEFFEGCLEVLLLQDETEEIKKWIKQLHGAEAGV